MKSGNLKIGIIGYGRIGKIHYQNVINIIGPSKVAICDPKANDMASEFSDPSLLYTDYQSLISSFQPNAIYICSPTPTHFDIISECCQKNIHVFCEKPVHLNLDQLYDLRDKIDDSGILFHVGFNRRYDPEFTQLKDNLLMGDIGRLNQLHIISRDPGLPSLEYIQNSGGMFLDMSIHDLDMARHIVGFEVNDIYAKGAVMINDELRNFNDIDTATIILTFANDITCTIHNSRQAVYGYDQRIEAFGDKGLLKANNKPENHLELWNEASLHAAKPQHFFLERYSDSYRIETKCFIDHLLGYPSTHEIINIDDAIKATQLAIAADQSMRMNVVVNAPCDV